MKPTASVDDIYKIIYTEHHDPFTVLGIHPITIRRKKCIVVRAFLPDTTSAFVLCESTNDSSEEFEMDKIHPDGFYEKIFSDKKEIFRYQLKSVFPTGRLETFYDCYSFLPTLTDFDLYLFGEGNHYKIHEKLGAHRSVINDIDGIQFAVWAPNARSVSVIGSFNNWDRRGHAMRVLGSSGVWEIFIPGILENELYKFEIKTPQGYILDKTDPYAVNMEVRPRTASIIKSIDEYEWHDQEWIQNRRTQSHLDKPVSIYEVHLGSWKKKFEEGNRYLTYRELATDLVAYVKEQGFTHIELLPIMEYPFDGSWGYQVTGYYAPTSRFGTPLDFMYFIDACHRNGIGVILDWVPAHFPNDIHALNYFDGSHLYEHSDPRKGIHQDWGTMIFNYGRNEVRNFLIANALYWLDKYHLDGLRIDAVASMLYLDYSRDEGEWIPNEYGGRENLEAIHFIKQLNIAVKMYHPGVMMIAEESTAFPGVTHEIDNNGLGFNLKWNMGWMHDMLEYFSKDPFYRKHHQSKITFSLLYAFTEQFLLPLSHDEVVHGKRSILSKMPGDAWQQFANARLLYGLMYGHPGKKLLFMGNEIGQWNEWNHDESIEWKLLDFEPHRQLQKYIRDLNHLYRNERALYEVDFSWEGFQWIDFEDAASSVISFRRIARNKSDELIFLCNFTPVVREKYWLGVPRLGKYKEVLNSDSSYYGGSNVGNAGEVIAEEIPMHKLPYSIQLRVPPLAVLILKAK